MLNRRGFTLIELLAVSAILALLAAILLPVLVQVRRKSYETTCLSNLRQLGNAVFLYSHDYDDGFPWGGDMTDFLPTSWQNKFAKDVATMDKLPDVLYSYTRENGIWRCPADTGFDMTGSSLNIELDGRPSAYQKFGMSYLYNTIIPLTRARLSGITAEDKATHTQKYGPAEIPLLYDSSGEWHGGKASPEMRYSLLFCDGHVTSKLRPQLEAVWHLGIVP